MNIRLIKSHNEIEDIAPAWYQLLANSDCHSAFASPVWLLASIEAFAELSPHLVIAESAGDLLGVMPLVFNRDTKQLSFLSDMGDYHDVIVASNDLATVTALLETIMSDKPIRVQTLAESVSLSGLRSDSNICKAMGGQLSLQGQTHDCYYADLSKGYAAYLSTRSANFRFNLRKAIRRAEESRVRIVELTPQQITGDEVVVHFLRLHLMRFPDKLFAQPAVQQFCRLLLPQLFNSRVLRVFALLDKEEVLGIHLALRDVNGLGIWNGGFDPRLSAISPGKLLINKQIEVCCDENLARYDFLRGDEPYKKSWSTHCQSVRTLK